MDRRYFLIFLCVFVFWCLMLVWRVCAHFVDVSNRAWKKNTKGFSLNFDRDQVWSEQKEEHKLCLHGGDPQKTMPQPCPRLKRHERQCLNCAQISGAMSSKTTPQLFWRLGHRKSGASWINVCGIDEGWGIMRIHLQHQKTSDDNNRNPPIIISKTTSHSNKTLPSTTTAAKIHRP